MRFDLNWKYLLVLGSLAAVAAVVNNLRVPEKDRVSWIGGQEILEKPAENTP